MKIASRLAASIVMVVAVSSPASAEPDWPGYGVLTLEDYKAYFQPGRYLAFMDELQITRRDMLHSVDWHEDDETGKPTFRSTWSALSVAENLLTDREEPYAKSVSEPRSATMTWQPYSSSFGFVVTAEEVEDEVDDLPIWLSNDTDLSISPGDVKWGVSEDYYELAHEQTGGACCLSDEEYDIVSIGEFTFNCSFVAHKTWEVMCIDRHVDTGYYWRTFYTRLEDSIG